MVSLDGEQLGIVTIERALEIAKESDADLVEVAPNAAPPVCRIMDVKKLHYEQQRKMKEARKHQRQVEIKSIRLRPSIDPHDYQTKLNQLRGFLLKGFKVKIMIVFKGAQLRRYELGTDLLDRMIADVKDIASLEPGSRSQRRMITALITPSKEVETAAAKRALEEARHRRTDEEKKQRNSENANPATPVATPVEETAPQEA